MKELSGNLLALSLISLRETLMLLNGGRLTIVTLTKIDSWKFCKFGSVKREQHGDN